MIILHNFVKEDNQEIVHLIFPVNNLKFNIRKLINQLLDLLKEKLKNFFQNFQYLINNLKVVIKIENNVLFKNLVKKKFNTKTKL